MAIRLSDLPASVRAQVEQDLRRQWSKPAPAPKVKRVRKAGRVKVSPAPPKLSELEQKFKGQLDGAGITDYVPQHLEVLAHTRRYSWDFAFLADRILIELQGGTWSPQRTGHSTGAGIRRDCEKSNKAQLAGWRVFKFTSDMVRDGSALAMVRAAREKMKHG